MSNKIDLDTSIPLVVDLDGTLLLTDSLVETFSCLMFRRPLAACASLFSIGNRAAFKRRLAHHILTDLQSLPQRQDLIELIGKERARGREVHLVTAADQIIADGIALDLGIFDSVIGSNGTENLKGRIKLAWLQDRFIDGFIYAGDDACDLPIFAAARGVILCDVDRGTARAVAASGTPVLAEISRSRRGLEPWLHALRLHQWSKNLLIFVPLFVGHQFLDPAKILTAVLGFLLLSLLASGTYLLNDLSDLSADRRHSTKRMRPFASGRLPLSQGLVTAPLMVLGALLGAFALSPAFALLLCAYLALTSVYSFGLKRVPLNDAFVIGALFTLRVAMGATVLGLGQSPWLLSFSLAFFVSLALAKRHAEVRHADRVGRDGIAGRGYRGDDWPLTLAFGIGAGVISLVVMLLYLADDAAPSGFYRAASYLYAVPVLMALWLMRIWLLSHRTELHDDPVVFALKDKVSLLYGFGIACAFFWAI